jgi:hypothetical protein
MFKCGAKVAVADIHDARFGRVGRVVCTNDPDNPVVEFEGWKFNKVSAALLVSQEAFRRIKHRTIGRLRYDRLQEEMSQFYKIDHSHYYRPRWVRDDA